MVVFKKAYGRQSNKVIADAGYRSEKNYLLLNQKQVDYFIPYNMYRVEQTRKYKKNLFHTQNLYYNRNRIFWFARWDKEWRKSTQNIQKTTTGFTQQHSVYQTQNCNGCPMHRLCFSAKGNRRIEINNNLQQLKAKARENLESETGKEIYAKRCVEPKPVFGNIKQNKNFKQFTLRKLPKINVEFGLVAITHNFGKWIEKIRLFDSRQFLIIINYFTGLLSLYFTINYKYSFAA